MNVIEIINLANDQPGAISFLGYTNPLPAREVLTGMINNKIKKRDFYIDIEPHRDGLNYFPKAKDFSNEVKNRIKTNCSVNNVNESSSEYDSAVTFISSFNNVANLLPSIYKKNRVGDIIFIDYYNSDNTIKSQVDSFLVAENIVSEFANGRNYSYIIKNKVPIKNFVPPKIERTRSQLT